MKYFNEYKTNVDLKGAKSLMEEINGILMATSENPDIKTGDTLVADVILSPCVGIPRAVQVDRVDIHSLLGDYEVSLYFSVSVAYIAPGDITIGPITFEEIDGEDWQSVKIE